jgi:hypothetical protein
MTHRRLGQAYSASGTANALVPQQRLQGNQEVEIDRSYIHMVNYYYAINRFVE